MTAPSGAVVPGLAPGERRTMDINGAVALIAGGGGGFGAATARRLHAAGARVVVSDLDEAKGKAVADELGDGALFVPTDVTDEGSVQRAVARSEEHTSELQSHLNLVCRLL